MWKKFLPIVCFIILLLLLLSRFDVFPKPPMSEDEKTAAAYVESHGYKIEGREGKVFTYILDKSRLNSEAASASGNLPYIQIWGLQENDPENYFGKEISTYAFTVSGHPLDKQYNTHTRVTIMMVDGEVVGGTSLPDVDVKGGPYDLDGRTLEEITGLSYAEWSVEWARKYND